ncbi:MAG: S1C family serine protease [Planctomycetaceae bacterium]
MSIIIVDCGSCGKRFGVADEHAGKLIRCPDCGEPVRVAGARGERPPSGSSTARSRSGQQQTTAQPDSRSVASGRRSTRESPRQAGRPERSGERDLSARRAARRVRQRADACPSSGNKALIYVGAAAAALVLLGVTAFLAAEFLQVGGNSGSSIVAIDQRPEDSGASNSSPTNSPGDWIVGDNPTNAANVTPADVTPAGNKSSESTSPAIAATAPAPTSSMADASSNATPAPTPAPAQGTGTRAAVMSRADAPTGDSSGSGRSSLISPAVNPNAVSGDRVAWLQASGNGYARRDKNWFFGGQASDAPYHAAPAGGHVQFPLIETMRTNDMIELFDPSSSTRIRLMSDKAVAHPPQASGEFILTDGTWKDSTHTAGWLAGTPTADMSRFDRLQLSDSGRLVDLIAAVEPNVVRVDVKTEEGEGNGSGFLLDGSGRVVTNYHVIEGAQEASVVFKGDNGTDSVRMPVSGFLHLDSKRDIAILQIDLPAGFQRPGLKLADELPPKGTSVTAFGAPLGLDFTASEGIVSGFRSAKELEETLNLQDHAGQWVQTTAPISPGNSGGPLVDKLGNVVAINTMTLRIGQSLNFGISCDDIRNALNTGQMYATALNPGTAPVRIASHGDESGGPGRGEPIKVEILPGGLQIFAIEDTTMAKPMLKDLDEVKVVVIGAEREGSGEVLEDVINDYVKKALLPNGVQIVRDEGPLLLVVAIVSGEDLELVGHLMVQDKHSRVPRLMRVWRKAGIMGTLTDTMSRRKRFLGSVHRNVQEFFDDLRDSIAAAKADPDSDSDDKEDDNKPDDANTQ